MTPLSPSLQTNRTLQRSRWLTRLRVGLCMIAIGLGLTVLAGWIFDKPILRSLVAHGSEMKPNTALCLILLASGVLLRQPKIASGVMRALSFALAGMVATIALLTLSQYWFSSNLGLDEFLFKDVFTPVGTSHAGRMSLPSAWGFIFGAVAIVLLDTSLKRWRPAEWLALASVVMPIDILLCYIYGNMNVLVFATHHSYMAVPTAIAMVAIALAILLQHPDEGIARTLTAPTRASTRFRLLLLALGLVPPIVGWLVLTVLGGHTQPPAFGVSLTVLLCMIALAALLWLNAKSANAAEEALSQQSNASTRLAAIVEGSDDAIISKDLNGMITSWNQSAERLFGYSAAEAIGRHITLLIPPERMSEETLIISRIRAGERIHHYETVRRHKDGTLLDISLTISPLKDAGNKIIGASKIARDITELRQARQVLAKSHEELERRVAERTASLAEAIAQMEEFSYTVSHDLRGPLRAMQGYAQATLEDYGEALDPKGREFLQRIVRSGERMDRLVRDLLSYSRIARAQMTLQVVSLDTLVAEIISHFPEMEPPRAEISVDGPLGEVLAHEPSLSQAIANLLNNAVKFVAPGVKPVVRIYSERRTDRLRLWVEDNGIGIKPEHQRRLFGLFERIHNNAHYEGTGIGLAIVRKSIERMGGQVGMESTGAGSKFWLELVAADVHRTQAPPAQPKRAEPAPPIGVH